MGGWYCYATPPLWIQNDISAFWPPEIRQQHMLIFPVFHSVSIWAIQYFFEISSLHSIQPHPRPDHTRFPSMGCQVSLCKQYNQTVQFRYWVHKNKSNTFFKEPYLLSLNYYLPLFLHPVSLWQAAASGTVQTGFWRKLLDSPISGFNIEIQLYFLFLWQ